jgi:hypothetical protein
VRRRKRIGRIAHWADVRLAVVSKDAAVNERDKNPKQAALHCVEDKQPAKA